MLVPRCSGLACRKPPPSKRHHSPLATIGPQRMRCASTGPSASSDPPVVPLRTTIEAVSRICRKYMRTLAAIRSTVSGAVLQESEPPPRPRPDADHVVAVFVVVDRLAARGSSVASACRMRVPSTAATSNLTWPISTLSPTAGARPSSPKTMPPIVW